MKIRLINSINGENQYIKFPCTDDVLTEELNGIGVSEVAAPICIAGDFDDDWQCLNILKDKDVNVDELNYLAKRIDSFGEEEVNQFKGTILATKPTELKDMINLTFNLHNYTLITDMSDLAEVGKTHRMNVDGFIPVHADFDYHSFGERLLSSGNGTITPYGVLFDNKLPTEDLYDGKVFPQYLYEDCVFQATIEYSGKQEYLYMPCHDLSINKAVNRLGAADISECSIKNMEGLQFPADWIEQIRQTYDISDIYDLNRLSSAMTNMKSHDMAKVIAVCDYADVQDFAKATLLAENIDSFEFAGSLQDTDDLGEYLIKKSSHYAYDVELDNYYDYEALGCDTLDSQNGRFCGYGYVGLKDDITISEILGEESDITLGGI